MKRSERQVDKLTEELADAGADHGEMARLGQELAAIQAELATAEEQWLELSAELEDHQAS